MREKTINILKTTILLSGILLLLILPSLNDGITNAIQNTYKIAYGEAEPDTNIVIIHITKEDLESIGPWPIKRNYYALLINRLTGLDVKKIGLEIFISSKLVTQTVYDKLLKNEIEKSGRVVLSSVAGKIIKSGDIYFTDSLSFPSPKLLNENFATGHLNYIKNDDVIIPLKLRSGNIVEHSFSEMLAEKDENLQAIILNPLYSWEKINNYSLLEFSEKLFNNDIELKNLKNKIVIVGISDPQFAATTQTIFDEQLPGVAMHAMAVDNLLNSNYKKTDFYTASGIIFSALILLLFFLVVKLNGKAAVIYIVSSVVFIVVTFILNIYFYQKLALAYFTLPFLMLIISEAAFRFFEKEKKLEGAIDEGKILKSLLHKKESELEELQVKLSSLRKEGNHQLSEKIKTLEGEIEKLKENEEDNLPVKTKDYEATENFFGIIYKSKLMTQAVELVKKAAPTDTTILIIGESGTGKELAAKAIHLLSKRKDKNFIAVNCGALSENLLESELFGHVRGAFTGANSAKQGRFEAADGGSIFLDEIGETSENFQVKLLRVLQTGEIEKVGSSQQAKVDVRVIAATNKQLEQLVKEKKFREDLFYRLNVFKLELPPLRKRKEDIDILALHFLKSESENISLSKAALEALKDYDWKGNVRELESVIKRAVILADAENRDLIRLSDLPKEIVKVSKFNFEDLVLDSLRNKKFSHSAITETARELGNVNRTMISENFRGIVFKVLSENKFDTEKTIAEIANTNEVEVIDKVRTKVQTFISNIENDLQKLHEKDFIQIKKRFNSKYKNLPVKFHHYLDEFIKTKIQSNH